MIKYNKNGVQIRGNKDEELIYESVYSLKHPELIGKRFNKLTVIDEIYDPLLGNSSNLLCECDCGNWYITDYNLLNKNKIQSCGCLRIENIRKTKKKNRKSKEHHRLRNIYTHMIDRCYDKKNISYSRYGALGIKVCDEWLDKEKGFKRFKKWALNNGYENDLTIDRINHNGNYEPSNCRWVTIDEQNRNKKNNVEFYDKDGNRYVLSELARKYNISRDTVIRKVASGELPYTCNDIQERLKHLQERQSRNDKIRKQRLKDAKTPFDYQNTDYFIINGEYIRIQELARRYNCTFETLIKKAYKGEIEYDDITFDLKAKYDNIIYTANIANIRDRRKSKIKKVIKDEYKEFGVDLTNDQLNEIYLQDISDNWSGNYYESEYEENCEDE